MTVFFDLDGTLTGLGRAYDDVLGATFETAIGESDPEWIDHYSDRFFTHFTAFADGPYQRAFADVADTFDLDYDPETVGQAHVDREITASEPVDGVRSLLLGLDGRVELGVLTNGLPAIQRGKLERHDLAGHFDVFVASHDSEVQALKPDSKIFEVARDRARTDNCVMIGDDYDGDVRGARANGFRAIHFDSAGDDTVITEFETLTTLLGADRRD